jgi:hypothetical protein
MHDVKTLAFQDLSKDDSTHQTADIETIGIKEKIDSRFSSKLTDTTKNDFELDLS